MIKSIIKECKSLDYLLCLVISWLIVNGWSYAFIFIGIICKNDVLGIIGTSVQAILWMPFIPCWAIIPALAYCLKKLLFRKNTKHTGGK